MDRKHNSELTKNARSLRRNMTKEENQLWYNFLNKYPVRFLRQKVIDNYIADFYCSKAMLVVELDGSQHYSEDGLLKDRIRTFNIEGRNIKVIRIPNNDIWNNFEGVCQYIDFYVNERLMLKESLHR